MLDAISDFWKPSKKGEADALDVSALQIGASVGFGFIPQAMLSGKRAAIHSINTYEFSGDRLTSYVLDVDGDHSVSLIVADGEGEKYIALSRRIPFAERMRMIDNSELLACMDNAEQKRLQTKQPEGEWHQWLADTYKKAIHGLQGKVTSGDYRSITTLPDAADSKEFNYTLLVSNNNEYAIEIEQYSDNRMEVYATVYRRISDIGEVKAPLEKSIVMAATPTVAPAELVTPAQPKAPTVATTARELAQLKPANDINNRQSVQAQAPAPAPADPAQAPRLVSEQPKVETKSEPQLGPVIDSGKVASKPLVFDSLKDLKTLVIPKSEPEIAKEETPKDLPDFEPVKAIVPTIQTLSQPAAPTLTKIEPKAVPAAVVQPIKLEVEAPKAEVKVEVKEEIAEVPSVAVAKAHTAEKQQTISTKENQTMATYNATFNGKSDTLPQAEVRAARAISSQHAEVENDVVECELRAANRIIEEAIRNEMRMSDVVRRIIALPVAQQEQVEIPVMLTDSDYHLLAIRYGIPAADRSAIKAKIVEEINDFSGSNRA
jgi:hypothetical protein